MACLLDGSLILNPESLQPLMQSDGGHSFVSNAPSVYSGPTTLLDNQLMKMEAELGYTCDLTLATLIQEALGEDGDSSSAEQVIRGDNRHACALRASF